MPRLYTFQMYTYIDRYRYRCIDIDMDIDTNVQIDQTWVQIYIDLQIQTRTDIISMVGGNPFKRSLEIIKSMTVGSIHPRCLPGLVCYWVVESCIRQLSCQVYLEQSILIIHRSYGTQWQCHSVTNNLQFNTADCSHTKIQSLCGR